MPRMNLNMSTALRAIIEQEARGAGMSAAAWAREAVARAAGWDLAISRYEARTAALEAREAALEARQDELERRYAAFERLLKQ